MLAPGRRNGVEVPIAVFVRADGDPRIAGQPPAVPGPYVGNEPGSCARAKIQHPVSRSAAVDHPVPVARQRCLGHDLSATGQLRRSSLPIDPHHMSIRRVAGHVHGRPVLRHVDPRTIAAERPVDAVDDRRLGTDRGCRRRVPPGGEDGPGAVVDQEVAAGRIRADDDRFRRRSDCPPCAALCGELRGLKRPAPEGKQEVIRTRESLGKYVGVSRIGAVGFRELLRGPAVGRHAPQSGPETRGVDDPALSVPGAAPRCGGGCQINRGAAGDRRPSKLASGKKRDAAAVG